MFVKEHTSTLFQQVHLLQHNHPHIGSGGANHSNHLAATTDIRLIKQHTTLTMVIACSSVPVCCSTASSYPDVMCCHFVYPAIIEW